MRGLASEFGSWHSDEESLEPPQPQPGRTHGKHNNARYYSYCCTALVCLCRTINTRYNDVLVRTYVQYFRSCSSSPIHYDVAPSYYLHPPNSCTGRNSDPGSHSSRFSSPLPAIRFEPSFFITREDSCSLFPRRLASSCACDIPTLRALTSN